MDEALLKRLDRLLAAFFLDEMDLDTVHELAQHGGH
jgi:hypothetical protein